MARAPGTFDIIFQTVNVMKNEVPAVQKIVETAEASSPIQVLSEAVAIMNSAPKATYSTRTE